MSYTIYITPIVAERILVDLNNEPDPIQLRVPIRIMNQSNIDIYVETVSGTEGYNIENQRLGKITSGSRLDTVIKMNRAKPSSYPVHEILDLVFNAYRDPDYLDLIANGKLSIPVEIDNYESWQNVETYTFDTDTEGWSADGLSSNYSVEAGGQSLYIYVKSSSSTKKEFVSPTLNVTGSEGRIVAYLLYKFHNTGSPGRHGYIDKLEIVVKEADTGKEHIKASIPSFANVSLGQNATFISPWYKFVVDISDLLGKDIQIIIRLYLHSDLGAVEQTVYLDHVVVASK